MTDRAPLLYDFMPAVPSFELRSMAGFNLRFHNHRACLFIPVYGY
jgi:hypothetical protein